MPLDMPLWLWLLALLTALLASTVTTITSIGAGLITYGVLGFFIDLKTMIPLFAPAQLLAVAVRCWLFREHIHWRLALVFFVGVIPGIYAGTWLFHLLSELALRRLLGVFFCWGSPPTNFCAQVIFKPPHTRLSCPSVGYWPEPFSAVLASQVLS